MGILKSCCGLWDLREGARNVAIISMIYDLIAVGSLLIVLLLHVPHLPWADPPQPKLPYQILLIVHIAIQSIHMIPSFILLYSTWEEISRGVGCWIFFTTLDLMVHIAWIPIPLYFQWHLDKMVITVSCVVTVVIIILYFISVVSSYGASIKQQDRDSKARRRLKDDYY